ncbi:BspA family leucine-rich repeat surface protein [Flagellimonas flava]|uniref:BspA family leucine-rich repeat surface protein n=1 Tax=Flagellimonas flava TaxID=570519 RepID=UPI003D654E03
MKKITLLSLFFILVAGNTITAQTGGTPRPFITTWKTDNLGVSDDNTISIPTRPGFLYDYAIDWGDGDVDTNVTGNISHTYDAPDTYTVSISGTFPGMLFNSYPGNEANSDAAKLIEINQWGDIEWQTMLAAFAGCSNLDVFANDAPDLSNVTSLFSTFSNCSSLVGNDTFNIWDVSTIEDFTQTFSECSEFNANVSDWDLSSARTVINMFSGASKFNQDISRWNIGNITEMDGFLSGTSNFNFDLSNWDVSGVTSMYQMFESSAFNQDIGGWNVSNVTNMAFMFSGNMAFDQDISNWNTSRVESMRAMFQNGVFNQDISGWDVSSVKDMGFMFGNSRKFNQDISSWDVSNVENMEFMFVFTLEFNQSLGDWDVGKVAKMTRMLENSSLANENYDKTLLDWSTLPNMQRNVVLDAPSKQYCLAEEARQNIIDTYGWTINDGGKATDCQRPFVTTWKTDNVGMSDDNQITIPTFAAETYNYTVDWGDGTSDTNVTGNITHTYAVPGIYTVSITGQFPRIFFQTSTDKEKIIEVNQWGDLEWKSMEQAFINCIKLDVLAIDAPDLSQTSHLGSMFNGCFTLIGNPSFNTWNVENVTRMDGAFSNSSFNQPIGNWDVSSVTNMTSMFFRNHHFNQNISDWNVGNCSSMAAMFGEASSFNQPIGNWNVSNVTNMGSMFEDAFAFNQDLSSWDVTKVTDMSLMFFYATSFNQNIGNWDVRNCSRMPLMFGNATSFNQNLGSWNVESVTQMINMFFRSGLKDDNYDQILIGWSQLPSLQNGVQLDAPQNQYCEAKEARQSIIDTYGWIINDDGSAETEFPIALCRDITVVLNDEGIAAITAADIDNGSTTYCGIESVSVSTSSFTYENIGPNTVTLTVTHENGNTASCDAQVMVVGAPLWIEDFNDLARGTTVDNGSTAWSAVRDGGVFEAWDGRFRINNAGSGPGTWTSEIVSISGIVSVSLDVDDSDQKKERADYVRALYILDGGTPVEFGFVSDDIDPQTFTADNLAGNTLQIIIESEVSGNPENYYIDNIAVRKASAGATPYMLTVNNGSGDGTYEEGEVVNIVADAAPSGQQFEAWVGDVEAVTDINSATTTLTMPSANAEITATYSSIPSGGTIWLEDFEDLVNGATVDNGSTAWNSIRDNGVFEVLNGRFRTNGSSSGPGTWTSEVISISGAVSISMDVDDSDLKKERADYLRAYYVLDGGTPVMFGSVSDDIDPQTFTAENLSGNTIQIIVESKVSGSPENYYIDNIAVSGFSTNLTARIGDNAESNTPKSGSPFEIKLYPNPATTQVTTTFDEAVELIDIKVFDMTGRLVKVHRVADQKAKVNYSMDVNELPSGTYFIIMEDAKGKQFRKQMVIGN